jgi:UDP-glucose 4-epimerase
MSYRPGWWIRFMAWIWPVTHVAARLYAVPLVGRVLTWLTLPLFSEKRQNLTYIPINEPIAEGSVLLSRMVVADLISRSSHRAVIARCTCRLDRTCTHHSIDIGCMLMGDGAAEIDGRIARHVSKEEALAHLDTALADGLMPLVGRAPIDDYIWGVAKGGRLFTVCFCCRCCCTILAAGRFLPPEIRRSIVPLAGVSIRTDEGACTLCGACVAECFMGALSIREGMLYRNEGLCKRCGRCAAVCPTGAIKISADPAGAGVMDARLKRYVTIE